MPSPRTSAPGRIPSDDTDNDDVPPQPAGVDSAFSPTPGGEAAKGRERAADVPDNAPRCPEGGALLRNTTGDALRFILRDEGNRPQRVDCEPNGYCVVPVEYADVALRRAPQLQLVTTRRRRPVDEV